MSDAARDAVGSKLNLRRDVARAACYGGGLGMALASAETLAALASGGQPRWHWWELLAICYGVAFASGQLLWLAASSRQRRPRSSPGDVRILFASLLALQCVALAGQVGARSWTDTGKLAASLLALMGSAAVAAWIGWWIRLRGWRDYALLLFVLSLASAGIPTTGATSALWVLSALALAAVLIGRAPRLVVGMLAAAVVAGPPAVLGWQRAAPRWRSFQRTLEERQQPDIVMIVLDTVRAANISAYGYARVTTPNMDAFARRATRYQRCSVTGLASLSSHASILTGLYPSRHGARDPFPNGPEDGALDYPLAARFETLAERLSRRGYSTAAIVANFVRVNALTGLDQGFAHVDARQAAEGHYAPLLARLIRRLPRLGPLRSAYVEFTVPFRSAEEVTDAALEWLHSAREGPRYFLFVNYMDAHRPYLVAPPFDRMWLPQRSTAPARWLDPSVWKRYFETGRWPASADEMTHLTARYDGALSYLDHHVGRLLRAVAPSRDVWIIVLADHGEGFGEHGEFGHSTTLYQEQLHVPLIVRYPPALGDRAGLVVDRMVQPVDLVPTLLDGIGLPVGSDVDGASLHTDRRISYSETFLPPPAGEVAWRRRQALTFDRTKLIIHDPATPELYDLAEDPSERENLAPRSPELLGAMMERLGAFTSQLERRGLAEPEPRLMNAAEVERLRALGYFR